MAEIDPEEVYRDVRKFWRKKRYKRALDLIGPWVDPIEHSALWQMKVLNLVCLKRLDEAYNAAVVLIEPIGHIAIPIWEETASVLGHGYFQREIYDESYYWYDIAATMRGVAKKKQNKYASLAERAILARDNAREVAAQTVVAETSKVVAETVEQVGEVEVVADTDETHPGQEAAVAENTSEVAAQTVVAENAEQLVEVAVCSTDETHPGQEVNTAGAAEEEEEVQVETEKEVQVETEEEVQDEAVDEVHAEEDVQAEAGDEVQAEAVEEMQPEAAEKVKKIVHCFNFDMSLESEDDISHGIMRSQIHEWELRKTFIKCSKEQSKYIDEYVSLRDRPAINWYILRVDGMIDSKLICERAVPLLHFFQQKKEAFLANKPFPLGNKQKKEWWKYIADWLTTIFRDVIRGLRILCTTQLAFSCGQFESHIFVTEHDGIVHGRLLPSLESSGTQSIDILGLKFQITRIIGMLFPEEIILFDSYGIPQELRHFMTFVYPDKLKYVFLHWLLDHPWIWDHVDRYKFIHDLRSEIKRGAINEKQLTSELDFSEEYSRNGRITWPSSIPDDSVFKSIFEKAGDENGKPVAKYHTSLDISRYMFASFSHINDHNYNKCKDRIDVKYSRALVDERLRSFFPGVYIHLFSCLYFYAKTNLMVSEDLFLDENLLELCSRLY